jgi:hypothetical protein
VFLADAFLFLARRILERALDSEQRSDETERALGSIRIALQRLDKVPPCMRLMSSTT